MNQSAGSGWVDIGTYSLYQSGNSKVVLEGNTGESGKMVAADASNSLESSVLSGIYQDGYKEVVRLQTIAAVGDIGASGAHHVHMEVYKKVDGTWNRVDPYGDGTNDILWLKP